uniref:VPS13_C domain-containing protein n=1 Tax=Angiostrongylus cantonensis TaxID=6313 RepID=A0A158PAL6_ANGCA
LQSRVLVEHAVAWSEEFPLDTVGNPARIICKGRDRDYELTVNIKLCQSGLTKIVTFCPFYLVSNLGKWDIQVKEYGKDEWIDCVGIWPQQRAKRKLLCARYTGQQEESLSFPITENFESLCQINNEYIGIEACVSTSESSVAIHLTPFKNGMAPACIMNNLKIPVSFGQKGHKMQTVGSNEMMYFTWSSVVEDRLLIFTVGDYTGEDMLNQNRLVDLQIDQNARKFAYLANFLIGRQRFLLFTMDLDIARAAYGSWETDTVNMQVELALQGVGLSLVDNSIGKELLYIGISSSDILWEEEVRKGRFKPFTVKYMQTLEEKYQEYLVEPKNEFQQVQQYEVSFANMIMKKKKNKEVKIRRIFEKGIWANYGTSAERTRLHLKVNHLQIDNQLGTCVFPRVLTNIPPPKSVIVDNAPKPFIELSLLQRKSEYSSIAEIEYARALVQEFAVQIDQGLINAIMALFASEIKKEPYGKQLFLSDMETALVRLEDTAKQYRSNQPRSFYNDLHISPLMIHLSFSQGGTAGGDGSAPIMPIESEFFKVLFQSIGVSITELQDVVFKYVTLDFSYADEIPPMQHSRLAYFERNKVFYGSDQLNAEIVSHYTMQALRQMYVLVLGLDIIGNPFGLVRDLSAGVEDLFYQPFQGLIQGPEEFATGVALGVQSMFGHAVGGAAGAVGRITGTVGKGVAALTFDQEYQRKRQEDLNRRPQSFSEGMARGVKGLGTGLVSGITGIVMKPIEGAKQEGGVGFVKGIGKGLIGAVTRPVSGVVDFASSTMHSVRTVAGADKEAGALRPPRVILSDHIVRPFSFHEALGFKIFNDVDRGELAETDNFVTYIQVTDKIVLLVTNMQLVLAKRTDLVGTWATEWKAEYLEIEEPVILEDGVKVMYKVRPLSFSSLYFTLPTIQLTTANHLNDEILIFSCQSFYRHSTFLKSIFFPFYNFRKRNVVFWDLARQKERLSRSLMLRYVFCWYVTHRDHNNVLNLFKLCGCMKEDISL